MQGCKRLGMGFQEPQLAAAVVCRSSTARHRRERLAVAIGHPVDLCSPRYALSRTLPQAATVGACRARSPVPPTPAPPRPTGWCRAGFHRRPRAAGDCCCRPRHRGRSYRAAAAEWRRAQPGWHDCSCARQPSRCRSPWPCRWRVARRAASPGGPCRCRRRPGLPKRGRLLRECRGLGLMPPARMRRRQIGRRITRCRADRLAP